MTALPKAAIATVLAAAVGTGIYEVRQATQLREQNQARQQQQAALAAPAGPAQPSPTAGRELPATVPISLAGLLVPAENDQWDRSAVFKIMPRGKQVFGGVEFRVEGMIQLPKQRRPGR